MKYFLDFEFLEGDVPVKIFGFNIPKWLIKPNNTIQPISVGLVSSDGREYYAISKDFNLKEAWNRYDLKEGEEGCYYKVYWIRENVLKPIFLELATKNNNEFVGFSFTYKLFKRLINKYGKTNKQIAEEIKEFCLDNVQIYKTPDGKYIGGIDPYKGKPEFYGYYADYDWVAFLLVIW